MGICLQISAVICERSTNLVDHSFGHKKVNKEHVQMLLNLKSVGGSTHAFELFISWELVGKTHNETPSGGYRKIGLPPKF